MHEQATEIDMRRRALSHATGGYRRADIDVDRGACTQWPVLFSPVFKRYSWRCDAYCLLDNHYHVVLESIEGDLSQASQSCAHQ